MPLPTTFAGVSARGEGLFKLSSTVATGSQVYCSYTVSSSQGGATTATWTCPAGVTSVSVVCVGPGGGTSGGGSYGGNSYFSSSTVVQALGGANPGTAAGTYFAGGAGGTGSTGGGGGAGGYTSVGGNGGNGGTATNGSSSTDGGGGGGGGNASGTAYYGGGGGGGVGLYGPNVGYSSSGGTGGSGGHGGGSSYSSGGSNFGDGADGTPGSSDQYGNGYGAAGGIAATSTSPKTGITTYYGGGGGGGAFGGGGGASGVGSNYKGGYLAYANNISVTPGNTYTVQVGLPTTTYYGGIPGGGGVRIVWPGTTRQFPSTLVSTTTNETVNSI